MMLIMQRGGSSAGIAALLSVLFLTACGWHLRGAINVNLAISQLVVTDEAHDGLLQQLLLQKLAQVGVKVVRAIDKDTPRLTLHKASQTRRVLTLASGNVEEYELRYRVEFSVTRGAEEVLLSKQDVETTRVYSYNASQVLAKEREQARLYQEMRQDVVNAMMYRLQSIQMETK